MLSYTEGGKQMKIDNYLLELWILTFVVGEILLIIL